MERQARPLRVLHFPINVLFAFFVDGYVETLTKFSTLLHEQYFYSRYTLIDPSSDEERLMDGFLSISMNQYKEICGIHLGGRIGLKKEQMDLCKKLAFHKVLELTDRIREVVADHYK